MRRTRTLWVRVPGGWVPRNFISLPPFSSDAVRLQSVEGRLRNHKSELLLIHSQDSQIWKLALRDVTKGTGWFFCPLPALQKHRFHWDAGVFGPEAANAGLNVLLPGDLVKLFC